MGFTFGCGDEVTDAKIGKMVARMTERPRGPLSGTASGTSGNALRVSVRREYGSYDAFRVPVLRPAGQHGIYNSQPFRAFDTDTFVELRHSSLEPEGTVEHFQLRLSASGVPAFELGEPNYPTLEGETIGLRVRGVLSHGMEYTNACGIKLHEKP